MSEALKEKISNDSLGTVQTYTLFNQNGIQITLDLPSPVQLNLNTQEFYPLNTPPVVAPVLHNKSGLDLKSATFTIQLNDVVDSNPIANVRWWNNNLADGKQAMVFTCGQINNQTKGTGTATIPGYSQIRWATMANNGRSNETFTVTDVSFTFNSSVTTGATDGPIVRVG
ncbi:hypothetical protein [Pseudomonas cucumis]|uniref:hypothetical protein n=1 Tax=Pseudomonas cucumis TaxID=2954082 RepID=UPI0027332754|nr:hypothetical protein [Pseudomonas cucumis]WLG92198.1 hypothetical protein PSH72_08965 [Pseudomonas cucumis]